MTQTAVPLVAGRSRRDIDRWANRVLTKHFPERVRVPGHLPVDELIDVILPREYGIDSGVGELPAGIEGVCDPPNRLTISTTVYAGIVDNPRDRFTGAHEAVHALLHLPELKRRFESVPVRLHRRDEIPAYLDPEWQANYGAAALLMPVILVSQMVAMGVRHPEQLADAFGVSQRAAEIRLNDALEGRLGGISL